MTIVTSRGVRIRGVAYEAGTRLDLDPALETELVAAGKASALTRTTIARAIAQARAITMADSYVSNGAARSIVGDYDLVIVKAATGAAGAWFAVRGAGFYGRTFSFLGGAGIVQGITFTDTGFDIGTAAQINTNGVTYHWFGFRDNGAGALHVCDHAGNATAGRIVDYFRGLALACVIGKRDNDDLAVVGVPGQAGRMFNGSAAAGITLNADSTMTLTAGTEVNAWAGEAGEAFLALGFAAANDSVQVLDLVGSGAARVITTRFTEIDCILHLSLTTTSGGRMWLPTLSAGQHLSLSAEAIGTAEITAVDRGRVTLGTTGVNVTNQRYLMIVFGRNRAAVTAAPVPRPSVFGALKRPRHAVFGAGSYPDFGTRIAELLARPHASEAVVMHTNASTAIFNATPNDDERQAVVWWCSNGDDATADSVSGGVLIGPAGFNSPNNSPHNGAWVAVTNWLDFPVPGVSFDVDDHQPWQTGHPVPARVITRIGTDHYGRGRWDLFVNDRLVKSRDRDMQLADPPRSNGGVGNAAHRLLMNARKRAAATPAHNGYTLGVWMLAFYDRPLGREGHAQNWRALQAQYSDDFVPGAVARWHAHDIVGTSWPESSGKREFLGAITGTFQLAG